MGKGARAPSSGDVAVTWEEVRRHNARNDKWIVIDDEAYDVTKWSFKHPGGSRILSHYAGQDASEAFTAFHRDREFVEKYMKVLKVGKVVDSSTDPAQLKKVDLQADFKNMRTVVEKMDLFRPSALFFSLHVGHILMFEVLAYLTLLYFGTGWLPYCLSIACHVIVQGQAAWAQHDFGHLSVFKSRRLNHLVHLLLMSHIKGASSDWWKHIHYQHHAKPNVLNKDPDVRLEALFVLGEEMPKRIAKENKTTLPYNWQHKYFFLIGPPLLFPLFFQYQVFKHPITRRKWVDLAWVMTFYVKTFFLYVPLLGIWGTLFYYFIFRCLESHWFVWVSQSNHIPMAIEEDKENPWLSMQLAATCNIEKSPFNDWFTGHLNHQIEHHLFPTMPRHNLYKIAPLVQSLCRKHEIPYTIKTLSTAFADIIRSLKNSGEIWYAYKESYHMG